MIRDAMNWLLSKKPVTKQPPADWMVHDCKKRGCIINSSPKTGLGDVISDGQEDSKLANDQTR